MGLWNNGVFYIILSEAQVGKDRPFTAGGKNGYSRFVICMETGKVYSSMKEASDELATCHMSIAKCCRGERKTAGGHHWQYAS